MDPLQWMGAVRMRVQTADKNITIMLRLKYESSINKIAFSSEKVILSESGENCAHIMQKQSQTVLIKYVCGLWCERTRGDELKCYKGLWTGIFTRSDGTKLKFLDGFFIRQEFGFTRC